MKEAGVIELRDNKYYLTPKAQKAWAALSGNMLKNRLNLKENMKTIQEFYPQEPSETELLVGVAMLFYPQGLGEEDLVRLFVSARMLVGF